MLLLLISFLGLSLGQPPRLQAKEAFTLDDYHIEMTVRNDNAYLIKESFTADFAEARHGLIRKIPLKSYRGYPVQITDVQANTGQQISRAGGYLNIRLGDENKKLIGPVHYELSYLFIIGDDRLKDMDELYFNLVGTDWDTSISNVSFRIKMPKPFSAEALRFTYGPAGSTAEAPLDLDVSETVIAGSLQETLKPWEGLTIALPLPEGYFDGKLQQISRPLDIIEPFFCLIWLVLGMALFFLFRQLQPGTAALSFYPPADLNPADLAYFYSKRVSKRSIAALLLHWANQGRLAMCEVPLVTADGKTIEDIRIAPGAYPARLQAPHESEIYQQLNQILASKGPIFLRTKPSDIVTFFRSAKSKLAQYWSEGEQRIFRRGEGVLRGLLFFLAALPPAGVLGRSFAISGSGEFWSDLVNGVWLGLFYYYLLPDRLAHRLTAKHKMSAEEPESKLQTVVLTYVTLILTLVIVIMHRAAWERLPLLLLALAAACAMALARHSLQLYTPYGIKRRQETDGFVQFLRATEQQGSGGFDAHYFKYNLAFAYALGLEEVWTEHFSRMVQASMDSANAEAWTSYAHTELASYRTAGKALSGRMSSLRAGRGSGGSSGGGSSGGGSGGGGGSSW